MDLKYFRMIKGLIITSKSKKAFDKEGKLTLEVEKDLNKSEIKRAVEAVWAVKVKKVWTISIKGQAKRFSGKPFMTQDYKKAIIALKEGYKIDVPFQKYRSEEVDQALVDASTKNASGREVR